MTPTRPPDPGRVVDGLSPVELTVLRLVRQGKILLRARAGVPGGGAAGPRTFHPARYEWRADPGVLNRAEQSALHALADRQLITDEPGQCTLTDLGVRVVDYADTSDVPPELAGGWGSTRAYTGDLLLRAAAQLATWGQDPTRGTPAERAAARETHRLIHAARQALDSADARTLDTSGGAT